MIPKVIHYCWFGMKPIPEEYLRYIESWKKYLPNYEIKEWNESNYDVNCIPFSQEAYEIGKFAYVSDYARLKILYENGGIYFDTDVEVIREMDDLMERGPWMAVEKHNITPNDADMVNLGLGFAVEPHNPIIKEIMSYYENTHYIFPDGHIKQITIVPITTNILKKHGLKHTISEPCRCGNITVYPWDYFCPQEFLSSKLEVTKNTYTIHHYSATWMTKRDKLKVRIGYLILRIKRLLGLYRQK